VLYDLGSISPRILTAHRTILGCKCGIQTEVQESLFSTRSYEGLGLPIYTILQWRIGHDYIVFLWEPCSEKITTLVHFGRLCSEDLKIMHSPCVVFSILALENEVAYNYVLYL
jgi:hypothetical protein